MPGANDLPNGVMTMLNLPNSAESPARKRRAHFWRLGRVGGGYSPTTNGAGENAGWTLFLLTTPRWRCEIHRTSKLQAEREAEMRAHPYVECEDCGDATSHDALGRCPCRT